MKMKRTTCAVCGSRVALYRDNSTLYWHIDYRPESPTRGMWCPGSPENARRMNRLTMADRS